MPRHCDFRHLMFSPLPEAPLFAGWRFIVTAHDVTPIRFLKSFRIPLVIYSRHCVNQVLRQAEHAICNSISTARDITDLVLHSPLRQILICLGLPKHLAAR